MKQGDVVTWSSSANGMTKTKRAEVLFIIPRGVAVWPDDLRRLLGPDYRKRFNDSSLGWGGARNHESYLVAVKGKGKPRLYWPKVSALRLIEDTDAQR